MRLDKGTHSNLTYGFGFRDRSLSSHSYLGTVEKYRAIAQNGRAGKEELCQKLLQQLSKGLLSPVSPVRVRLALFVYSIYFIFGAIAQLEEHQNLS